MIITNSDKNLLLNRFPDVDLLYENIINKKFNSNLYFCIPKGKKYLIWFTYFKYLNVCLLCELHNNEITKFTIINSSFNSDLCLGNGTILYGTYFNYKNVKYFTCENIHYYMSQNISNYKLNRKLHILDHLFSNNLKQINYHNLFVIFTLPVFKCNFNDALKYCNESIVPIYSIQCRFLKNNYANNWIIKDIRNYIFKVKPNIKDDTYEIFCINNKKQEIFYDYALIPDYKTSKMMNKLFRNIKENENLDLLEQSDDEEDFENTDLYKYVNINITYNMKCKFSDKFKQWVPLYVVDTNNLLFINNLSNIKK